MENSLPKLSAPARRALDRAGYATLEQLAKATAAELKQLHGIGPNAIKQIKEALQAQGLSFTESE